MISVDVRREVWQDPSEPITSDRLFSWDQIDKLCIHYTGAFDEDEDPYGATGWEAMRNVQRVYLNRGYSFGYSWGIHPDEGLLMEGRGTTYRAASNGPDNDTLVSVIVFVDDDKKAPPIVVERLRQLVAELRAVKPGLKVVGHQDLDATGCPGAGLQQQVVAGEFEPVEGEEMKLVVDLLPQPKRMLDTRQLGGKFSGAERAQLAESDDGGPLGAVITLTAVSPVQAGYATVWAGGARPNASSINFDAGTGAIANTTFTKLDSYGGCQVFSSVRSDYVIDVIGWLR